MEIEESSTIFYSIDEVEENGYACAICNDTEESTSFTRFTSTCEHIGHTECVILCIKNNFTTCPICRARITRADARRILPVDQNSTEPVPAALQVRRRKCNVHDLFLGFSIAMFIVVTVMSFATLVVSSIKYKNTIDEKSRFERTWVSANCTYIRVELKDAFHLNYTIEITGPGRGPNWEKFISSSVLDCDYANYRCGDIYTGKIKSYVCYYDRTTMKDGDIPLRYKPVPKSVLQMGETLVGMVASAVLFGLCLTAISLVIILPLIAKFCN